MSCPRNRFALSISRRMFVKARNVLKPVLYGSRKSLCLDKRLMDQNLTFRIGGIGSRYLNATSTTGVDVVSANTTSPSNTISTSLNYQLGTPPSSTFSNSSTIILTSSSSTVQCCKETCETETETKL